MAHHRPIKVIGCGGIGTWLLDPLCMFLHYQQPGVHVTLIDGDSFEEKNKQRQKFAGDGNKAEVKAEELRDLYPDLYFSVEPEYLTERNVIVHLRDNDIVFLCVDNHATRRIVGRRCESLDNVVLISGGNEYTDGNIQVHVREKGTNLTLPITNEFHPEITHPADLMPGERPMGCQEALPSTPQLVFMNNTIATMMANAYYAYLEGVFHGRKSKVVLGESRGPQKYDEACVDILVGRVVLKQRS